MTPKQPLLPTSEAIAQLGQALAIGMRRISAACVVTLFGDETSRKAASAMLDDRSTPEQKQAARDALDRIADRLWPR